VPGVGQVIVGGSSRPAVRVEANPTILNRLGLGLEAVRAAVAAENTNQAKGSVEMMRRGGWSQTTTGSKPPNNTGQSSSPVAGDVAEC